MNETETRQDAAQARQAVATTAQTPATGLSPEALLQRQLHHVGAAYGVIFALLFFYVWRLTSLARRLSDRVDELEREGDHRGKR